MTRGWGEIAGAWNATVKLVVVPDLIQDPASLLLKWRRRKAQPRIKSGATVMIWSVDWIRADEMAFSPKQPPIPLP